MIVFDKVCLDVVGTSGLSSCTNSHSFLVDKTPEERSYNDCVLFERSHADRGSSEKATSHLLYFRGL